MIRFLAPEHNGGRVLVMSGEIKIGAVFPPNGSKHWRWRLWVCEPPGAREGKAKTEQEARDALRAAWESFLVRAHLTEAA